MSLNNKNKMITPKSNVSRIQTRSRISKIPSPGLNVEEMVAKLQKGQLEIKTKLEETIKQAEEEKVGLVNEIKSLELALKITQEDHKNEILKLQELSRAMSEEINLLKTTVTKKDTPKLKTQPLINTVVNEKANILNRPSCDNGRKSSYSEVLKMATKPIVREEKNTKSRVLLLADSHGRGCSALLNKKLNKSCDVQVVFKPNAPLNVVVESVGEQVKDFGKNDYLIVLGGTNDIDGHTNKHLPQIINTLNEIVPLSKKTNLIVNTIPVRFDRPELNRYIKETNKSLHVTINNLKNKNCKQMGICFINERLKRSHYTKHGLHLNESGKAVLCNRLTEMIESRLQSPVNVTNSHKRPAKDTFLVKWLKSGKGA